MIYVASKTRHAPMWRQYKAAGAPINSSWIYEAEPGQTKSFTDLWKRCVDEAGDALVLIVYAEDGDVLKGAFVEMGVALATGATVLAVGLPDTLSVLAHPLVEKHSTVDVAMVRALQIVREGNEWAKLGYTPTEG